MNNVKNSIGWADFTVNPITGCSRVSEGCRECYALKAFNRNLWDYGVEIKYHPKRMAGFMRRQKPAKIFICSMSDLFHDDVWPQWILEILRCVELSPQHTAMILTKRPERMRRVMKEHYNKPIPNLWLGVSAENQKRADERIPVLLQTPAAKRFVSCEPLLGEISLHQWLEDTSTEDMLDGAYWTPGLDWVIAGPENGAGKRHCDPEWIEWLAKQCDDSIVPFYDKRKNYIRREWPEA